MQKILAFIFVFFSLFCSAQSNPHQNINLLGFIDPNTSDTATNAVDGRRYSGCWGWHQSFLNKEYAIIASSKGTFFIDVTIPSTPSVCAFVPGKVKSTAREVKTYQQYCYITCDEPGNVAFQIVDMSTLPATVTVISSNNNLFDRGHTLWINQDKLYVAAVTYSNSTMSSMNVYSLSNPTAPVLLRRLEQDCPSIGYVHDMYVRNDTVFASCAFQGLYILKFNPVTNTFMQLGSYTGYGSAAYNHSSCLTQDGKYLLFCDETVGAPIRFVDVQNLSNIQPVQNFLPYPNAVAHNPFLIGNKWAIVSCYQDGLYIYDISQPGNVAVSGYFDTYPVGGGDIGNYYASAFRGNWGAYPYLPSGIIIAADMQLGIFILDPAAAYNNPVGLKTNTIKKTDLTIYPNPASSNITINYNGNEAAKLELKNILGQTIFEKQFDGKINYTLDVSHFLKGNYLLSVTENDQTINKKLIVN